MPLTGDTQSRRSTALPAMPARLSRVRWRVSSKAHSQRPISGARQGGGCTISCLLGWLFIFLHYAVYVRIVSHKTGHIMPKFTISYLDEDRNLFRFRRCRIYGERTERRWQYRALLQDVEDFQDLHLLLGGILLFINGTRMNADKTRIFLCLLRNGCSHGCTNTVFSIKA